MNERDEQAVREAMRDRNRKTTQSEQTGENAAQFGVAQLGTVSDKLADNIVDMVWADAMRKAFSRLGKGDMGKLAPRMLTEFEEGITSNFEIELAALEEWNSPKYALPSSSEFSG